MSDISKKSLTEIVKLIKKKELKSEEITQDRRPDLWAKHIIK